MNNTHHQLDPLLDDTPAEPGPPPLGPRPAAGPVAIADLPDDVHPALVGDPSRCLSAEAAAEHLGVGRTTVYRLLSAGELRSITIGRCRRIPLTSIAAYVAGRIVAADGTEEVS